MRRSLLMETLVCAGLLAFTTASAAQAFKLRPDKIPAYNVDASCALPFNGDRSRTNACIEAEQDAYEHLKAVWLTADRRAISECESQIRSKQDMVFFYEKMDRCIPEVSQAFAPKPEPEAPEHFRP